MPPGNTAAHDLPSEFMTPLDYFLAAIAALLIGVSKAGFGGGTAILATPLMALVVPPHMALGTLLPLLIVGDFVSCWLYRGVWRWQPLLYFLPGCTLGILLGTFLLGRIDETTLQQILGAICLTFCAIQWARHTLNRNVSAIHPGWSSGSGFGIATGVTSTLAHAAGPVFAMYLLPMQLPQRIYMATTVLGFTLINLLKLPAYLSVGTINAATSLHSLRLAVWVVVGAFAGEWLNRHCPAPLFKRIVYLILFLTGLELISGKSLLRTLFAFATATP
jgi:uncharacterized membrane protein YfcA